MYEFKACLHVYLYSRHRVWLVGNGWRRIPVFKRHFDPRSVTVSGKLKLRVPFLISPKVDLNQKKGFLDRNPFQGHPQLPLTASLSRGPRYSFGQMGAKGSKLNRAIHP